MRIYTLALKCGDKYPQEPPQVKFVSKINLNFVNKTTGVIEPDKLPILREWKQTYNIEMLLSTIKNEMCTSANRKLPQPPEGTNF